MANDKVDPNAETKEKPAVAAAAQATSDAASEAASEPDLEFIEDELLLELSRSVWHRPFRFLLALVCTFAAPIGFLFVPAGSDWLRYLTIAVFVISLGALLLYLFFTKIHAKYNITKRRCSSEYGFISRVIQEVEIRHIRNINVRQSLIQRIFGIGDVEISSAGGADVEVTFESVADPLGVRRLIMDRKS